MSVCHQQGQEDKSMIGRKARLNRTMIEQARSRFERWHKTRPHFSPLPEALWASVVEMARAHGANKASKSQCEQHCI
jgi:hypothetical protein